MVKTLRFHQSEETDYLISVKDRAQVRVVLCDRASRDNYNAITLKEFCEIASPAALADFERFMAKSLALSYADLHRDAEVEAAQRVEEYWAGQEAAAKDWPSPLPRAEFYCGESVDAKGAAQHWFFSTRGGSPHVILVDDPRVRVPCPENTWGIFVIPPSTAVDMAAFWRLTGIDRIQENLRRYRDGEAKAA